MRQTADAAERYRREMSRSAPRILDTTPADRTRWSVAESQVVPRG